MVVGQACHCDVNGGYLAAQIPIAIEGDYWLQERDPKRPPLRDDLQFFVSPIVDRDEHAGPFWIWFEDAVAIRLANISYGSKMSWMLLRPMILDVSKGPEYAWDDFIRHHRDGCVQFGFNLDFESWDKGSDAMRIDMLIEGIGNAMQNIRTTQLSVEDRNSIIKAIKLAGSDLKAKLKT